MSTFKDIANMIGRYVSKSIKLKSLTADDIRQLCSLFSEHIGALHKAIGAFDNSAMTDMRSRYDSVSGTGAESATPYYRKYLNNLSGTAKATELRVPFSAVLACCTTYMTILNEIKKHADDIIVDKSIEIKDARVSSLIMFSILREIDVFITCSEYLWTHYLHTATSGDTSLIKYKLEYLNKFVDDYSRIVTDCTASQNRYSFMADVKALRSKNADLTLYANGQNGLNYLDFSAITQSMMTRLTHGVAGFNMITWIFSRYTDWQHERYLRNQQFKEWAEQSVTLYKMKISSGRYTPEQISKMEKIVNAYEVEITKRDRKIKDYENSVDKV